MAKVERIKDVCPTPTCPVLANPKKTWNFDDDISFSELDTYLFWQHVVFVCSNAIRPNHVDLSESITPLIILIILMLPFWHITMPLDDIFLEHCLKGHIFLNQCFSTTMIL